jgi:small-conductance mechanosensitive channel
MKEFGNSSVDFLVSVWTESPWHQRQLRSDVNEAIWWALKEAGITIAFPQLDVHFDPEIERSMTALAQA